MKLTRLGQQLLLAVLMLCPGLLLPASVNASAVAIANGHMAATAGADRPAVTHFQAGVTTVYFDYSVLTPSSSDAVDVEVFKGGLSGKPLITKQLYVGLADDFYVPLRTANKTAWPKLGYCTLLFVNGVRQDGGGMPIGWSVGSGGTPSCATAKKPAKLQVNVHTAARAGKRRPVHVLALSKHAAVPGATVVLKARRVGVKKVRTALTNAEGKAEFKHFAPKKPGVIRVVVSKTGYVTTTVTYHIGR
ncbi:MAG TPA: hypothetical protein VFB34_10735 [Chloroflexota bacterium]|nr:hypothetical protein [Chloroflexota bacterium]